MSQYTLTEALHDELSHLDWMEEQGCPEYLLRVQRALIGRIADRVEAYRTHRVLTHSPDGLVVRVPDNGHRWLAGTVVTI